MSLFFILQVIRTPRASKPLRGEGSVLFCGRNARLNTYAEDGNRPRPERGKAGKPLLLNIMHIDARCGIGAALAAERLAIAHHG